MATTYYWTNNTGTKTWGTAGNWSRSSGGPGDGAVPTSADPVIFDSNSTDCIVNASARFCASIDFTGFTGNFTMNFNLTVSGNVTLDSGLTVISGSGGTLIIDAASTIKTLNGFTWPTPMQFNGTNTKTLVGNLNVSGSLTINGITTLSKTTSETLNLSGGLVMTTHLTSGNVFATGSGGKVVVSGGTLSGITGCLNIDTELAGTVNISNDFTFGGPGTGYLNGATLKYVSGTITWSGTLRLNANNSLKLDLAGTTLTNVLGEANGGTITLLSNCTISGNYTEQASTGAKTWNGYSFLIGGDLNLDSITTGSVTGTTVFVMKGNNSTTGTWSMSAVTTGALKSPLTFDSGSNTVAISGTVNYNTGTLTYSSGTVTTSGSTLVCADSTTFDTGGSSGIDFNNVTMKRSSTGTKTMTSQMYIGGVFTLDTSGGNILFAGTGGILTH